MRLNFQLPFNGRNNQRFLAVYASRIRDAGRERETHLKEKKNVLKS